MVGTSSLTSYYCISESSRLYAKEIIKDKGVNYYAMSDAIELLPIVYNLIQPGEGIARHIENYFKTYGIKEITLL